MLCGVPAGEKVVLSCKRLLQCAMRIPIVPISGTLDELAIIELQGEVIPKNSTYEEQTMGPLTIEGNHATLIIGNHELRGKVQTLKKPLLMLKKGNREGINAVAYVKKKVVFSERPMLIFPQ